MSKCLYSSLNCPKLIVAPMVDQSELAWRHLSRAHGAQLCYTPMFNAKMFTENERYRNEMFTSQCGLPEDRPLIVQFCANDPDYLLASAKLVQDRCDAVDLNLGCPQHIAKRGHYGAYLMEDWDLISSMVKNLSANLSIPITCKIRIYPSLEKTLAYAKMLQESGCTLLTVHGRTREQKGHHTGLADWEIIKKIKASLSIPVFANGNILYYDDVNRCLEETGADGVMTAEGNLYNPAIFEDKLYPVWQLSDEYLNICRTHPNSATISQIRGHLFKMLKPCLSTYTDSRSDLGKANTIEAFTNIVQTLKDKMLPLLEKCTFLMKNAVRNEKGLYDIPMWYCQGYFRPPLVENSRKMKMEAESEIKVESVAINNEKRCMIEKEIISERNEDANALCPGAKRSKVECDLER